MIGSISNVDLRSTCRLHPYHPFWIQIHRILSIGGLFSHDEEVSADWYNPKTSNFALLHNRIQKYIQSADSIRGLFLKLFQEEKLTTAIGNVVDFFF